jgi:protein SCO1
MRNYLVIGLLALGLLAFVYFKTSKSIKKRELPYLGIDSIQINGDTVWHKVGNFKFINQKGDTITQKNLNQTIYVADFFFVQCPGICKDMATQLRRVYKAYENNPHVKIISHTVNPEHDSVSVLMEYAQQQGIQDAQKWMLVTGSKKEIYQMARDQYYSTATQGDGGPDDFVHTERFVLVDTEKRIRGFYDGTSEAEINQLMFDIDKLLKEK